MDCLRSFNFSVNLTSTYVAPDIKQWTTGGGEHYWQVSNITAPNSSRYNIQGFKNIDVYGIDVIGTIGTQANVPINGAIINDWIIEVLIDGQQPQIGANIPGVPNAYALDLANPDNNVFPLGKFTPSLKLESPYASCKFIELQRFSAQGIGWQTAAALNLGLRFMFVVYYRFQGE